MAEKSLKTTEISGLSTKVIAIAIIVAFVCGGLGVQEEQEWWGYISEYYWFDTVRGFALFFVFLLAISLIQRIKKVFSRQEIAMLAILVPFSLGSFFTSATSFNNAYWAPGAAVAGGTFMEDVYKIYQGHILYPSVSREFWMQVIDGSLARGDMVSIDWGLWTPWMIWNILFQISLPLIGFSIALLLRRTFIEVENLPFPWADCYLEVMDQGLTIPGISKVADTVKGIMFNKYFVVATLATFLWMTAAALPASLKWLLYNEPFQPTIGYPGSDLGVNISLEYFAMGLGLTALPFVWIHISLQPYFIGWMYILPMDILVSFVLGWIAFGVIIPIVYNNMGLLGTWSGAVPFTGWSVVASYPGANMGMLVAGMVIGVAAVTLWRARVRIGATLKTLVGEKVSPDVDPAPPIPYNITWMIFIVSTLIWIAVGLWAQMPVSALLVWTLLMIVFTFAAARIVGEGGFFGIPWYYMVWSGAILPKVLMGPIYYYLIQGAAPQTPTAANVTGSIFLANWPTVMLWLTSFGVTWGLTSFYIAKRASLRKRDVFIGFMISTVMTAISLSLWSILSLYVNSWPDRWMGTRWVYWGAMKTQWSYDAIVAGIPATTTYANIMPDALILFVAGILITLVIQFFREKFPKFRISAVGLILAFYFGWIAGVTSLVALAIKYLTIRVGGVGLYNKVGKPLMIGAILGYALMQLLNIELWWLWDWRTFTGFNFP